MSIKIKPVRFTENGFMTQPFALGGVAFEDLPDDRRCPRCRQPKEKFNRA